MQENGPTPRCPECNNKAPEHAKFCRAGIDDSRPMTSAVRYADLHLPNHEEEQHRAAYGRADADIRPTGDPEIKKAAALLAEEDEDIGHETGEGYGRPHTPAERSTAIAEVSGLDPIADARARAVTEGLNPKDLIGAVKTPLGLLPWTALVQVAGVFAVGAEKYGAYNWRTKGQPVQHVTYVAAAFRHLAAYMDGQTIDPETGCNHLAHAACGLLILLDASAVGNSIDNRPTPGVAAEIMALKK